MPNKAITFSRLKRSIFGNYPMTIKRSDIVLELGSGHNPYYRSDILLDKYIADKTERGGSIVINRPFVVADACALPFQNKSIDYVVCRHILEHMEDPSGFAKELERVGKRGYIETPSIISEEIYGWPFHKWKVSRDETKILMESKEREIVNPLLHPVFHKKHVEDGHYYRFYESNLDLFLMCFEWDDKIPLQVNRKEHEIFFSASERDTDYVSVLKNRPLLSAKQKFFHGTLKALRKVLHGDRKFKLLDLVACPNCKGQELDVIGEGLLCPVCKTKYDIVDGIPILLPKEDC